MYPVWCLSRAGPGTRVCHKISMWVCRCQACYQVYKWEWLLPGPWGSHWVTEQCALAGRIGPLASFLSRQDGPQTLIKRGWRVITELLRIHKLVGLPLGARLSLSFCGSLGRQECSLLLDCGWGTRVRSYAASGSIAENKVGKSVTQDTGMIPPGSFGRWCQWQGYGKVHKEMGCFQVCGLDHGWQTFHLGMGLSSQNSTPWFGAPAGLCNFLPRSQSSHTNMFAQRWLPNYCCCRGATIRGSLILSSCWPLF